MKDPSNALKAATCRLWNRLRGGDESAGCRRRHTVPDHSANAGIVKVELRLVGAALLLLVVGSCNCLGVARKSAGCEKRRAQIKERSRSIT